MVKTYLEKQIVEALEERGLVDNGRQHLFYRPERTGEGYRRARRWVMNNITKVSLSGLMTAAGTAYFFPRVAAGIGAASFLGMGVKLVMPLDEFFYHNPGTVAKRVFKNNIVTSWHETYGELEISTRKELDSYVLMAQTSSVVQEAFPYYDNKVSLGIAVAKIADILSEARIDNGLIAGISLDNLVEMVSQQKFGTPEEVAMVKELTDNFSAGRISRMLRKYQHGKTKRMDESLQERLGVLDRYTNNYEFALRIADADESESIGSQLSRGSLVVARSVGSNAGCYAGMHSQGKDFPRMTVKDDCGPSYATHAERGLFKVGGDADQGFFDEVSGGIGIVEGIAKHDFAHHMTDKTWPAVAVTVGGTLREILPGTVYDGIVVCLNRSELVRKRPRLFRFQEGKIIQETALENYVTSPEQAADIIKDYIRDWKPK